jgi:hypothetical protein
MATPGPQPGKGSATANPADANRRMSVAPAAPDATHIATQRAQLTGLLTECLAEEPKTAITHKIIEQFQSGSDRLYALWSVTLSQFERPNGESGAQSGANCPACTNGGDLPGKVSENCTIRCAKWGSAARVVQIGCTPCGVRVGHYCCCPLMLSSGSAAM